MAKALPGGGGGREAVSLICCGFVMAKALLGGGGREAVSLICCGFVMAKALPGGGGGVKLLA